MASASLVHRANPYQVTDGLKAGDKIVAAPSTTYKEDSFKVKVVDKLSTTK